MSIVAPILNFWLRHVEKPAFIRADGAEPLRKRLAFYARYFFHPPRGTQMQWLTLSAGQAQVEALDIVPRTLSNDLVLLYFHGGAFVFGSPRTHSAMVAQLGGRLGARAVLPKYRLAPEAPFPAAFEDARTAWAGLLHSGVAPEQIVIGGDSAGGALALALLAQILTEGGPKPAGLFAFSPLTDMRYASDSFAKNAESDVVLAAERAHHTGQMYLAGTDPQDPRVSPLFADFKGAPPIWMTVGDTEILLDDSRAMTAKLREAGADATLIEERDLPHVWPLFHNTLPEARQTLDAVAAWIRTLPSRGGN